MIGDCSLHVGYAGLDDHKGQLSLTSQPWVTHRMSSSPDDARYSISKSVDFLTARSAMLLQLRDEYYNMPRSLHLKVL